MKVSGELDTDVQGHTMGIHYRISRFEAEHICTKYNIQFSSSADMKIDKPMLKGINEIGISPKPRYSRAGKKLPPAYEMSVVVNIRRAIGLSGVGMVSLSQENVQRMINSVDKSLTKLGLSFPKSKDWYIKRLDAGFDVPLGTDDPMVIKEYVRILHYSFNLGVRGYDYTKYYGYDKPEVREESVTIQNGSGRYNIYYKLVQLLKLYPEQITDEVRSEIADILRIEKQLGVIETDASINSKGLENAIGTPRTVERLLDSGVTEKLARTILQDAKLLFGTGDYVPLHEGVQIIRTSNYTDEEKKWLEFLYMFVNQNGGYANAVKLLYRYAQGCGSTDSFKTYKKSIDLSRMRIEKLGISIVESGIGYRLDGIDKLLENTVRMNRKPRCKGVFGKIRAYPQPSGKQRYKCNATLHDCNGKAITKSITGNVGASYDESDCQIFGKIVKHIKAEEAKCKLDVAKAVAYLEIALRDVENYKTLDHSEDMLKHIDDVLDQIKII